MKKVLVLAAAISAVFDIYGAIPNRCRGSFTGFYFGLGAAVSSSKDKVERYYDENEQVIATRFGEIDGFSATEDSNSIDVEDDNVNAYANAAKELVGSPHSGEQYYISSNEDADPDEADAENWYGFDDEGNIVNNKKIGEAPLFTYFSSLDYASLNPQGWATELNRSKTTMGGSIILGYMFDTQSPVKIGVEFGFDAIVDSQTKNHDQYTWSTVQQCESSAKRSAVRPNAGVVFGLPIKNAIMPYFKIGVSRHKTNTSYQLINREKDQYGPTEKHKTQNISATIALGFETKMDSRWSTRYEVEYRFGKKSTKTLRTDKVNSYTIYTGESTGASKIRINQKPTVTLRMLVVCRPDSFLGFRK